MLAGVSGPFRSGTWASAGAVWLQLPVHPPGLAEQWWWQREPWITTACMYECVKCVSLGKSPWEWVGWVRSAKRWEGFAAQCSRLEAIILHCTAQLWALGSEPLDKFPVLAKGLGTFLGGLCQNVCLWRNLLWQSNCGKREGLTGLLKTRLSSTRDRARLLHSSANSSPVASVLWGVAGNSPNP